MSNPPDVADFVAVEAAGKLAGISPRTLRHWIATGKLPAIPGKRGKLVRLEEVRRLAVLVGKEPLAGNAAGNSARSAGDLAGNVADTIAGNAAESVAESALVSNAARQQLAMVRDEWLAPLVAQITEQAERIGRLEGERTAHQETIAELRRQRDEDRERERQAQDEQRDFLAELRRRADVAEAELAGARLRLAEVSVPAVVVVAGQNAPEGQRAMETTSTAHGLVRALWGRLRRALQRG